MLPKHKYITPMLAWIEGARLPTTSFLDIGCHDGSVLDLVKQNFPTATLYGIDTDPDALDLCPHPCDERDMHTLKDAAGIYDWVICASVLRYAHNGKPFDAVNAMARTGIILNECLTWIHEDGTPQNLHTVDAWHSMFENFTPVYLFHSNYHTFWSVLIRTDVLNIKKKEELEAHAHLRS